MKGKQRDGRKEGRKMGRIMWDVLREGEEQEGWRKGENG